MHSGKLKFVVFNSIWLRTDFLLFFCSMGPESCVYFLKNKIKEENKLDLGAQQSGEYLIIISNKEYHLSGSYHGKKVDFKLIV